MSSTARTHTQKIIITQPTIRDFVIKSSNSKSPKTPTKADQKLLKIRQEKYRISKKKKLEERPDISKFKRQRASSFTSLTKSLEARKYNIRKSQILPLKITSEKNGSEKKYESFVRTKENIFLLEEEKKENFLRPPNGFGAMRTLKISKEMLKTEGSSRKSFRGSIIIAEGGNSARTLKRKTVPKNEMMNYFITPSRRKIISVAKKRVKRKNSKIGLRNSSKDFSLKRSVSIELRKDFNLRTKKNKKAQNQNCLSQMKKDIFLPKSMRTLDNERVETQRNDSLQNHNYDFKMLGCLEESFDSNESESFEEGMLDDTILFPLMNFNDKKFSSMRKMSLNNHKGNCIKKTGNKCPKSFTYKKIWKRQSLRKLGIIPINAEQFMKEIKLKNRMFK